MPNRRFGNARLARNLVDKQETLSRVGVHLDRHHPVKSGPCESGKNSRILSGPRPMVMIGSFRRLWFATIDVGCYQ
jgi:hypothetical protein